VFCKALGISYVHTETALSSISGNIGIFAVVINWATLHNRVWENKVRYFAGNSVFSFLAKSSASHASSKSC
jgi:hypothetical protein